MTAKPRGPAPPTPARRAGSKPSPARHVAGEAASTTIGTDTRTTQSSDWLAEREIGPADLPADQQPQGVEVSMSSGDGLRKGRATESKRGQR